MLALLARALAVAACLTAAGAAAVLWNATGRAAWTRYHDPDREQRDRQAAEQSLGDLFEDTGVNDGLGALETQPNRFSLGLLPSGSGRHAVSLLTIAGPALLAAGLIVLEPRLRRRPRPAQAPAKPGA